MNITPDRKLIILMRNFVEKALLPQIKKFDGSLIEWNKFLSLISVDNVNISQVQLYVDTLPTLNLAIDKPKHYQKREDLSDFSAFNPNKTFGGQRNKVNIPEEVNENFIKRQIERDTSFKVKAIEKDGILLGMQKLLKSLEENQSIIENLGFSNPQEQKVQRENQIPQNGNHVPLNGYSGNRFGFSAQMPGQNSVPHKAFY